MRRVRAWALAIPCFALAIVGAVVPVMHGWPFLLAGLSLVAPTTARRLRRRLMRRFYRSEAVLLDETAKHGAVAGFTTRHFPVRVTSGEDLTRERTRTDLVAAHRSLLAARRKDLDPSRYMRYVSLRQVHGDRIVVIDHPPKSAFETHADADAVITRVPELTLIALTADCLSIFYWVPDPSRKRRSSWVGVAHAGWRGTRDQIAVKTLRALCERSGERPERVQAAFGPSIGCAHYEVGEEFASIFPRSTRRSRDGKLRFDLSGENRRQLIGAGLKDEHLHDHGVCTAAEAEDFYSYRREKENAGRMLSWIALTG